MNKPSIVLSIAAGISLACSAVAHATAQVNIQDGSGAGPFSPGFWSGFSTTDDLLFGQLPSEAAGDFSLESSGGIPVLTDGLLPPIPTSGTEAEKHAGFATVGASGGTLLTYSFDLPVLISSIQFYGGWNDFGRSDVNVSIYYSTDNGGTYNFLATANKDNGGGGAVAFLATVTDDTSTYLGDGAEITNLRFEFGPGDNGFQGMEEIAAYGIVTVPEPATGAVVGVGIMAMIALRCRRPGDGGLTVGSNRRS